MHVRLRMFTCTSQECQRSRHSSARCDLPDGTHDRRKGCVQGREEGGGKRGCGEGSRREGKGEMEGGGYGEEKGGEEEEGTDRERGRGG